MITIVLVVMKEGAQQQALLQETHDKTMSEFAELGGMMEELKCAHAEIGELVAQIHVKVSAGAVDVEVTEQEVDDMSPKPG